MKKMLSVAAMLSAAVVAGQAQGVLSADLNGANEVPANLSASIGSGSFVLNGDDLSFTVNALLVGTLPVDAGVFGPAGPTQTGPMVFDLGTPTVNPIGGNSFVSYSGVDVLTPAQVNNVLSDLDYVNVMTTGAGFSAGEIRGQVILLPEPSAVTLLGIGAGMVWMARRKKAA